MSKTTTHKSRGDEMKKGITKTLEAIEKSNFLNHTGTLAHDTGYKIKTIKVHVKKLADMGKVEVIELDGTMAYGIK
jgi:hypothetical protein